MRVAATCDAKKIYWKCLVGICTNDKTAKSLIRLSKSSTCNAPKILTLHKTLRQTRPCQWIALSFSWTSWLTRRHLISRIVLLDASSYFSAPGRPNRISLSTCFRLTRRGWLQCSWLHFNEQLSSRIFTCTNFLLSSTSPSRRQSRNLSMRTSPCTISRPLRSTPFFLRTG